MTRTEVHPTPQAGVRSDGDSCRFCGTALEHTLVDLGSSPPCESFRRADELSLPSAISASSSSRAAPALTERHRDWAPGSVNEVTTGLLGTFELVSIDRQETVTRAGIHARHRKWGPSGRVPTVPLRNRTDPPSTP